jgi:hypothetical protein
LSVRPSVRAPINQKYEKLSAQTHTRILIHDQSRVQAEYCEEKFKIGGAVRSVQG